MERQEPSVERDELLRVLDELSSVLRGGDAGDWADRVQRDRRLIADGHPDALGHLLGLFGGSKSLRDVTIDGPGNARLRLLCGAALNRAASLQDEASDPS